MPAPGIGASMIARVTSLHVNDPDRINLRKALRAAIVAPLILLIADQGFGHTLIGVFGFLSAFCAFVFADFGGPIRGRAFSYLALLVASDLSLVAGSLTADTTALAGLTMAIIMFAVLFAGVFSSSATAFVGPVALAFAFAVFIPLETIGIVHRLIGWSIGGLAAAIGAVMLWPVNSRSEMRTALAAAATAFADVLSDRDDTQARSAAMARAAAALDIARARATAPLRPAHVAAHDVGLVNLVESLSDAHQLVEQILAAPPKQADTDLVGHVVEALRRTSAVISGTAKPQDMTNTISSLDHCLVERRHALANEVREMVDDENRDPAAELDRSFPLLALSHLVLWIEADAAEAMGAGDSVHPVEAAPELRGDIGTEPTVFLRLRRVVRANLDPDGVVWRNSLRGAVAMAIGVVLAKIIPIDHGFWIVLGVLTVLRTSAASTSATALSAIAGTIVGFAVSAGVLLVLGGNTSGMWWLLPVLVFLAGYAPGAVGFAVGQVAFTVMVVCLFDIFDPQGVTTAIVRLEAVSLGAVSAAAVALVLWPRGARAALARATAVVYRAAAEGLAVVLSNSEDERRRAAARLEAASERATAAFAVALGERGEHIHSAAWTGLGRPPSLVHALLCGLQPAFPATPPSGCTMAADSVRHQVSAGARRLMAIAERLEATTANATGWPKAGDGRTDTSLNACLCACATGKDGAMQDGLSIMGWKRWLDRIHQDLGQAERAQAAVAGAASETDWLRWSVRPKTARSATTGASARTGSAGPARR